MGTECSVAVVTDSESVAHAAFARVEDRVRSAERAYSRFLVDSELSVLNRDGRSTVTPEFIDILMRARELWVDTIGIFNPLVQVARLGYDRTFDTLVPSEGAASPGPYSIEFDSVEIDVLTRSVRLRSGQQLDLGGMLKGYLAERIADQLTDVFPRIQGTIVNLGGDLCTRGADVGGNPFAFEIYNPVLNNAAATLTITDACLATSGTYKRRWLRDGMPTHHLLDATGTRSVETNVVSASVVHADGATAEAYAKVLLALGPTVGPTRLPADMPFVIVASDGSVKTRL